MEDEETVPEVDEFEWLADLNPEGALPLWGCRILLALDEQGHEVWYVTYSGTTSVLTATGLLELVKLRYVDECGLTPGMNVEDEEGEWE